MARKLEAEGLDWSNRQDYLLEAVLQAVQWMDYWVSSYLGYGITLKEFKNCLSDPDLVHIAKTVLEPKLGAAAERKKAEQDVGEWMLTHAQQQGITLTKKK